MRLVCPNCSAQYEIETSMIPDEGRDVQCSNCGHTWFELPPPPAEFGEAPLVEEDTLGVSGEDQAKDSEPAEAFEDTLAADEPADEPGEPDEPSHAAMAIAAASEEADDDGEEEGFDPPPVPETRLKPRRPADAAQLDILREEAERELSQRRAPPSEPIETQTDMGLDEIRNRDTPTRALRARMAHLKAEDEPKDEKADDRATTSRSESGSDDGYQAPRRDLLPDIDEINSTLKATNNRTEASPEAVAKQRGGFRWGFVLMVLLSIAMILAYARAPAIARVVPATEPTLLAYVDKANAVRDWLDGLFGTPPAN